MMQRTKEMINELLALSSAEREFIWREVCSKQVSQHTKAIEERAQNLFAIVDNIFGGRVWFTCRKNEYVFARTVVVNELAIEGYKDKEIARVMGKTRTQIAYLKDKFADVMACPTPFCDVLHIYEKFNEQLCISQKNNLKS